MAQVVNLVEHTKSEVAGADLLVNLGDLALAAREQFGGRLLLTSKEVAQVVPLHPDTIAKLIAPGGEWDRYGMVRRFAEDGPRNVLISLPLLVEWSLGGPESAGAIQRQQEVISRLRTRVRDLEQRLKLAGDSAAVLLSLARGGQPESL